MAYICTWALFVQEQHQSYPSPVTSLSLQPSGGRRRQMNSLITDDRPRCSLSVEALKRDGVNKRCYASMDKSFDGMHEKYDFDSIRCSVKKTISISISMIVTSVLVCTKLDLRLDNAIVSGTKTLLTDIRQPTQRNFMCTLLCRN